MGAVLILQAILIVTHDPFVDEWQALQIAVQSPDLAGLLANLHYEGHPPLWYLVLRAISQITGPHHTLVTANLLLAGTVQWLILFRSPFPHWLRLLIALSEPLLFEYGTISRSYTLGVAITFWAMASWNSRRLFWLPLALLPAVDFFFGLISLALLLLRLGERRVWLPGLLFWALVSGVAALTVIPAPDFVPVIHRAQEPWIDFTFWLIRLSVILMPLQWPHWNMPPPFGLALVLWFPFLLLCIDQTRNRPIDRMALGGFVLVFMVICTFMYSMANRHLMLIGVLLIALQWRHSLRGEAVRWPFAAWAAIGAACGLATAGIAFAVPFERETEVARIIRERGLQDAHWVSAPVQYAQGVSAITGVKFEGVGVNCMNDFIRWNFEPAVTTSAELGDWVNREVASEGRFYLVSEVALPRGVPAVEIARIPAGYVGKPYFLYEAGPRSTQKRKDRPRCVPSIPDLPPRPHQAR